MSSFERVPVKHARVTRREATRIMALRHVSRTGQRPSRGGRALRMLATVIVAAVVLVGIVASVAIISIGATVGLLSADLPNPSNLETLSFAQPTVVYDRSGKVVLGQFQQQDRRVVSFLDVPRLVLDATTSAEDRTFWTNPGFDAAAILSAVVDNASGTSDRGASTITQQLVRARLLPESATAPGADQYIRKAKEIIQAMRVSDTFPGEVGKERIITAYLNEIFYGHGAYGIAAAAKVYFGVDNLDDLTLAQAALLAGLPKSPTNLDPYLYAEPDSKGRLVVQPGSPPIARMDYVLNGLAANDSRWTFVTPAELQAALTQPIVLAGDKAVTYAGGQFTWQVRTELESILGSAQAVETGGYKVITTLDWRAQQIAQKYMTAAAISPNLPRHAADNLLRALKIPSSDMGWIRALRGKDLHNGALVALDYRTGDVLAYLGSAGYNQDKLASAKFSPKFDAAGDGSRQPGSAFKPILYSAAFDAKKLDPGSLLLDITTTFNKRENWTPHDADQLERGPVLVRKALQYSLNIPAIRALNRVGNATVASTAQKMGIRFTGGKSLFMEAGLAAALGTVEVRPLDLTSAYGTIADGGVHVPPRMILQIIGPDGKVVWQAPKPAGTQAISPQAAFLVSDVLSGNTDPKQNPIWSAKLRLTNGKGGAYRQAAAKTGTASEARDLSTYGFLPPPTDPNQPGLVVGIWMGNSDHSNPRSKNPAISLTAPAPLWHAFMRDYTNGWPLATFQPPPGVVKATIDAWTGGAPGPWTRATTTSWFIDGTQPGGPDQIDPDGLLYSNACGGWRVDPVKAELGPSSWDSADANWMSRARRGVGVSSSFGTRTAFFWGKTSWGGSIAGSCGGTSSAFDNGGGHQVTGQRPKRHGKPPKPH
jgi:membrane peptidoglycan carboxypeptidase